MFLDEMNILIGRVKPITLHTAVGCIRSAEGLSRMKRPASLNKVGFSSRMPLTLSAPSALLGLSLLAHATDLDLLVSINCVSQFLIINLCLCLFFPLSPSHTHLVDSIALENVNEGPNNISIKWDSRTRRNGTRGCHGRQALCSLNLSPASLQGRGEGKALSPKAHLPCKPSQGRSQACQGP